MADDNQNSQKPEGPFAAGSTSSRLSDRVARVTEDGDPGVVMEAADSMPLHKMHDGRVVRPAGRMIVGSRAPTPIDPANAVIEHPQLFSSDREGKPRLSGGAAVAVVCAVAVGATAALTAVVNKSGTRGDAGAAEQSQTTSYQSNETARAGVAQSRTTPVAAISPASVASPAEAVSPNLIRIANQDAPGLSIENISGPAGTPIPVKIVITLADSEEYSFLMFRGLPDNLSMSAGFRLKDSWAVSLRDVQKLALISPPGYEGSFKLEVLLVKGRNTPVESRIVSVRLGDGIPDAVAEEAVASIPSEPAPASRILTAAPPEAEPRAPQIEPERPPQQQPALVRPAVPKQLTISPDAEASMLDRANRLLGTGDVSSARLLFEHIAKKGSGKAALALAQTYDPAFLRSMNTLGLKADPAKAKEWYGIAAGLGQTAAEERLSELGRR